MNLFLAIFWLALAGAAFVLAWVEPDRPILRLAGTDVNVGWLALAFCVYNGLRWLSTRRVARRKRQWEEAAERSYPSPREGAERNPAFDFRDRPPGEHVGPGQ